MTTACPEMIHHADLAACQLECSMRLRLSHYLEGRTGPYLG